MRLKISKQYKVFSILIAFLLTLGSAVSQTLPNFSGNIEDLSDEQIKSYWQQVKAQGYTLEQLKSVAQARGVSASQIATLERRVGELGSNETGLQGGQIDNVLGVGEGNPAGLVGRKGGSLPTDPLFGYDFFNNQNITFTPNLNLPTPRNYQLGPGDEVVINLWGAAENTYVLAIDRTGALRIPNVGPVYVNGMDISEANEVIKIKMRSVYAGISAPKSSPYKVFVDINLAKVRTVQINIIGEVKVPGTYSLSALSNVLNALYASGGPTKEGTFRKIKLIRNGEDVTYFDFYKYLIEGSQEGNNVLRDQDLIVISPFVSRVNVSGAVKRPGMYEILPDENLNDLFKYVSGFESNAYKKRFLLERIEEDRRVVKELEYKNASVERLKDGDRLIINTIIDKYENRVEISGAVYRPGPYELVDGLTLKDIIEKAAGLDETAYMDRGLLFRRKADGVNREVISFSPSQIMSGEKNIILKPNDQVQIINSLSLKEDYTLTIDGAVQQPNTIPYVENMTIEDLVLMAGGFTDAANTNVIDVFRRVNDDNFDTLAETFKISSDGLLSSDQSSSFVLLPNDRVSVRKLKGFSDQKRVSIEGEINFPGTYSVPNKMDRISDLVLRAGGISEYAYLDGATLIRQNPYAKDEVQQFSANALDRKNLHENNLNNIKEFPVGIDLRRILNEEGKASKTNLVLENGDKLIIPSVKETIKVEGEVLVPSMVAHQNNLTLKNYIEKSGGFSSDAKKGKVYVIYPNGDIATTKNFLFFRSYPNVKPGSIVLVPTKPENRSKLSATEIIGIATGVTTLGILIDRLLD